MDIYETEQNENKNEKKDKSHKLETGNALKCKPRYITVLKNIIMANNFSFLCVPPK